MLIVFRSQAAGSVTMFGAQGTALLELMGQSGVTPGAIKGPQIGAALAKLRSGLASAAPVPVPSDDDREREPDVPLARRAVPLIELLERSAAANADVIWEKA